jgi:large subunit ribosomal protein L3
MIPVIIGTKGSMTHYFDDKGVAHAVTGVVFEQHYVTQIKTVETDGYSAIQIGSLATKESRVAKPQRGHLKELPPLSYLMEIPMTPEKAAQYTVGQELSVSDIAMGTTVHATGITKAKGFQGGVKRHGFHGDKASHGRKHSLRKPGSIGGGANGGGRVVKGKRMAGRMGGDINTVRNLSVLAILPESQTLLIKGALPGRRGAVVELSIQA